MKDFDNIKMRGKTAKKKVLPLFCYLFYLFVLTLIYSLI